MAKKMKTAIIVGAGIGGLTTAARLSKDGYQVTILEKDKNVGGRANVIKQDGYTFDTGPTILMMTDVLYDTFSYCGKNFDDYINLSQLEPNYQVKWADGSGVEVSSNLPRFAKSLAKIDPKAPEQFYTFFGEMAKMYRIGRGKFIDKNFDKLTDFINVPAGLELLKGGGLKKLYSFVSTYFDDPRLRMLFSFQSMYLGVSPYEAPAVYGMVSYMETGLGIWYPKGGMHKLPEAFAKLVKDMGGEIRVSTPVQQILIQDKVAYGVKLEGGEVLKADVIVCNADLPYAYKKLIEPKDRPKVKEAQMDKLKQASSALLFYWGVNDEMKDMLHHNVYFSKDFRGNLDQIFHENKLPTDPAFYIYIPTKTDPKLAPKGRHAVYILVPVPNLDAGINWDTATEKIKKRVLERMKKIYKVDIAEKIESEAIFSPQDFETRFNLTDGTAFGLSHHFFQSGYFRPSNKARGIERLYFAGASTYPGSGVPMVTLSGKLVAERIAKELQ